MYPADVLLSCWITETARSAVLSGRGHGEPAARAAERARMLASACSREGRKIEPAYASRHADWMSEVAGHPEETGPLGWFFLQRLGVFVEAHASRLLDAEVASRLAELSAPDAEAVATALASDGLPSAPPPEWPGADAPDAPGKVLARIGILGDPHVGLPESDRVIPAAIDDMNREQLDLTVVVGDITQNGAAGHFKNARRILDGLRSGYLATLGNHDMWGGGADSARGIENFTAAFQREPFGVAAFDGIRVIALNSADPAASPFPPFDLLTGSFTDEPHESVPGGRFTGEMLGWMDALEPGPRTFAFLHHPPHPYLGLPPITFGLDEPSTRALAGLVERLDAEVVVCGHTHRCALHDFGGVDYIEMPCTKEWPFAYAVLTVTEEGWSYVLRPVSDTALVEELTARAGMMFRRYARGPATARALSRPLKN